MKKYFIIALIVLMTLILSACSTSDNTMVDQNSNNATNLDQNKASETSTENFQMRLVANCEFLNASDIATNCGKAVSTYKKGPEYGPCTFDFTDKDDNTLSFIYNAYTNTDNKEQMYSYLLSNGCKKITDFTCIQDGNVYVLGDKYSLSLGNSLGTVCSDKQLENLGILLKKRVYGK